MGSRTWSRPTGRFPFGSCRAPRCWNWDAWPSAETAFRDDMKKFPENGWSLSGLKESLERQKKTQEAAEVTARLEKAWARADK